MKKIVIFTQNLSVGGVQKSVITLANHLKSSYEVIIILAEDDKPDFYNFNNIIKIPTIKIDITDENAGKFLVDYRTQKLDEILYEIKPDLLISFEDYNNILALKTDYKCKKIISCRVSLKTSYDKKVHLLSGEFYAENIKNLYPKANKIISVSQFIQNELMNFGLNSNLIYNGVKIQNKGHNAQNIICLGRLHPQKGQTDLIKAFNEIKDEISENLIIIGDGVLRAKLENLVNELNLQNRVTFTGFINPDEYIKNCKIAVMPSYYEGFSNSVLEIISYGKPILAYNYDGADEIFDKNDLVELGNYEELAFKLKELLKNDTKRENLANKYYEKAKKFDIKNTLREYEKIIEEILECAE